jgi:ribosomal-protein-alanine N-acetyltransferase
VKTENLEIVPMTEEDLGEVSAIERESFSLPWSSDNFREIVLSQLYRAFVAKDRFGRVAGYIIFYVASDEGHVMNVATHPKQRQKGIAQKMLDFVHRIFITEGVKSAYLELRRSNYSALRLYKKTGYIFAGLRKGYYADNMEDAIVMRKPLD